MHPSRLLYATAIIILIHNKELTAAPDHIDGKSSDFSITIKTNMRQRQEKGG
jgi:hypothetical protein